MKKQTILFFLLIFCSIANALEINNTQGKLIHSFGVGNTGENLGFFTPDVHEAYSPTSIKRINSGEWLIGTAEQRLLLFSNNFKKLDEIKCPCDRLTVGGNIVIAWVDLGVDNSPTNIIQIQEGKLVKIIDFSSESRNDYNYVYIDDNYIIAETHSNVDKVWKVNNGNVTSITLSDYVAEKSDVFIENGKYPVKNGIGPIVSYSGLQFIYSFGSPDMRVTTNDGKTDILDYGIGVLFGIDKKGNHYYDLINSKYFVVSPDGEIIAIIKYQEKQDYNSPTSIAGIDIKGNIYYLRSSKKEHKLMMIECYW